MFPVYIIDGGYSPVTPIMSSIRPNETGVFAFFTRALVKWISFWSSKPKVGVRSSQARPIDK